MGSLSSTMLNEKFKLTAAFYKLQISGRSYICRSVAKIVRKGSFVDEADALFVISYPGSLLPVDKRALYHVNPSSIGDVHFQKGDASQTEQQFMRLIERMDWNKAYVVNLTDIHSATPSELAHELRFMEMNSIMKHSIFTEKRMYEIDRIVAPATKIIAGWGFQQVLNQQALCAMEYLLERGKVYGLKHKTYPYYYHPSALKSSDNLNWLDQLEVQLRVPID